MSDEPTPDEPCFDRVPFRRISGQKGGLCSFFPGAIQLEIIIVDGWWPLLRHMDGSGDDLVVIGGETQEARPIWLMPTKKTTGKAELIA